MPFQLATSPCNTRLKLSLVFRRFARCLNHLMRAHRFFNSKRLTMPLRMPLCLFSCTTSTWRLLCCYFTNLLFMLLLQFLQNKPLFDVVRTALIDAPCLNVFRCFLSSRKVLHAHIGFSSSSTIPVAVETSFAKSHPEYEGVCMGNKVR